MLLLLSSLQGCTDTDVSPLDSASTQDTQAELPAYLAVAAGTDFICALTGEGGAKCFGDNDDVMEAVPNGQFTTITAGYNHACALRSDGNPICWGSNKQGQASFAAGDATKVVAGGNTTCILDTAGDIRCSDLLAGMEPDTNSYPMLDVGLFGTFVCGAVARDELTTKCQAMESQNPFFLEGMLLDMDGYGEVACGIDSSEDTIGCTTATSAEDLPNNLRPPPGEFLQVVVGLGHGCGLKETGVPTCWGSNIAGEAIPRRRCSPI